ncbi:MAG: hypothetical protein R2827_05175 [Bdellovibrionales bacterium]
MTAREFEFGAKIVDQIKEELAKIKGVNSLETDLDGDSIKYRLIIDNEYAVSEGVDPRLFRETILRPPRDE